MRPRTSGDDSEVSTSDGLIGMWLVTLERPRGVDVRAESRFCCSFARKPHNHPVAGRPLSSFVIGRANTRVVSTLPGGWWFRRWLRKGEHPRCAADEGRDATR